MQYQAEIDVMPKKELLDPQGKAVANNVKNLDIQGFKDVRIGKHISIVLEASSREDAEEQIAKACKALLSNPIMEDYSFEISELQ